MWDTLKTHFVKNLSFTTCTPLTVALTHTFLCSFQAFRIHFVLQKQTFLHREHFFVSRRHTQHAPQFISWPQFKLLTCNIDVFHFWILTVTQFHQTKWHLRVIFVTNTTTRIDQSYKTMSICHNQVGKCLQWILGEKQGHSETISMFHNFFVGVSKMEVL